MNKIIFLQQLLVILLESKATFKNQKSLMAVSDINYKFLVLNISFLSSKKCHAIIL